MLDMKKISARILIVDDNEMNRDMLSRRLTRVGMITDTADDGNSALAKISNGVYDLVLLDIMMPGMDGFEVLKRVREIYSLSELPVIMATAKNDSKDIVEALKHGANDYVTKPFDFPVVCVRVENALAYRQAVHDLTRANEHMRIGLETAARVQQSLLPQDKIDIEGAEFTWFYRPCDELAGDGLNIFKLDDEHVVMYVLDVSGHGVPSALLSVSVTHHISQLLSNSITTLGGEMNDQDIISPAWITSRLNTLFPMKSAGGHYLALVFGVLNVKSLLFSFVCAGCPGPIVVHDNGTANVFDVPAVPVGMLPDSEYGDTTIELQKGDTIYLHSDGLYEERNPETREMFGRERLNKQLSDSSSLSSDSSIDSLVKAVADWRGDEEFSDDIAVIACALQN